jgi:hypothetical protein
VKTGALTSTPVILTATIDTAKIRLKAGLSRNYQIVFRVSGRALKKISVKRVDAKGSQPITTSLADRAEFIAQGVDRNDAAVSLTPVWSIDPPIAGSISLDGVFRPDPKFIGFVRVFGTVGNLVGEYVDSSSKAASIQPGLSVQRLVAHNTVPDTARNGKGVSLVFPAGIVPEGSQALISLSVPQAQNMLNRGYGNRRMVDSNAYEIKELNDIAFDTAGRKINLVMELPGAKIVDMFLKDSTFVALWDTLTLQWKPLRNSIIAADGRSISAELSHFSRYAIVSQPSTDFRADMIISPNPFSPRVRPGNGRPLGTCIKATVAAPEQNFISLDLRIYSLTGDLVWGLEIRNGISNREYSIWWDGTTTNRIENGAAWTGDSKTYIVRGKNMCRNGRYFAVLTANGYKDKSLKLMKQIVLMK